MPIPPAVALLLFVPPLALAAVWLLRSEPGRVLRAAGAASLAALAVAVVAAKALAAFGPVTSALPDAAGIGLSVRLEALSAVMLALVALVGVIVVRYSRHYLDGDSRITGPVRPQTARPARSARSWANMPATPA